MTDDDFHSNGNDPCLPRMICEKLNTTSLRAKVITTTVEIVNPDDTHPAVVAVSRCVFLQDNSLKMTEILRLLEPTPSYRPMQA
ncbi:MAG: hypothetical protein A2Z25_17570 [Planctomycetes bacterium RBG_16_55_9]|nr:MAG: hypothetical protein A2Z25_17570 [Planctomycetes bacterium RBG_16_55_9]